MADSSILMPGADESLTPFLRTSTHPPPARCSNSPKISGLFIRFSMGAQGRPLIRSHRRLA